MLNKVVLLFCFIAIASACFGGDGSDGGGGSDDGGSEPAADQAKPADDGSSGPQKNEGGGDPADPADDPSKVDLDGDEQDPDAENPDEDPDEDPDEGNPDEDNPDEDNPDEEEPEEGEPTAAECDEFACTFDDGDSCNYANGEEEGAAEFQNVEKTPWKNRISGVRKADSGFMGAYLAEKGQKATLEATGVEFAGERSLKVRYWDSFTDMEVRGCCDTADDCPYTPGDGDNSLEWQEAIFACPAGTTKVIWVCERVGDLVGGCGVDEINFVDQDEQPLCPKDEEFFWRRR